MQQLDQVKLAEFLYRLSSMQAEIVTLLRATILTEDPQAHERLEEGRWLHGYLKYESPHGRLVYAIGAKANGAVSFHAMTYYGSQELQERYGRQLEPFVAGKSCFDFPRLDEIPVEALHALVRNGSLRIDEYVAGMRR
jgi:hypothetical protein